jgi:hypothetical protein
MRRAESAEVAHNILTARKTSTVVDAIESSLGHGEPHRGGLCVNRVHDQLDHSLADGTGLAVDDVMNDLRVKLKR